MKRTLSIFLLLFLAFSLFGVPDQTYARENHKDRQPVLSKISTDATTTNRTLVNIGQIAMWIWSNQRSANSPTQDAGLYFPRGSNPSTTAIYEDGFVWGGIVNDGADPALRVNGSAYRQGTVPGAITSPGVRENSDDKERVDRVWRIRRDFATATDEELRQDAAEFNQIRAAEVTDDQIQQIRDIYRKDWEDWPAWKGAPFYDADGDGQYNPQFNSDGTPKLYPEADEPGYANGDQVAWLVCNDLSEGASFGFAGSPPIGIELQITLWAYHRADAMGNIIFKQFRYIYKGTASTPPSATIDSMYVMQWSDPDVGEYGDDYAGCDTLLSLGYAYNSSSVDAVYIQSGYPPPASGYDFFAGPLIESPGSEGVFGLRKVTDHKNLPMTTFGFFAAGGTDSDPAQGVYQGTQHYWNLFRGYRPRPISPPEPWKDPDGNETMFRVPGDPVKGIGWIDGQIDAPGDRRILLASGPFTMAYGDTNETVVAVIVGLGSDRLSSISVLKFYDRAAQEAFDNLFELAKAPPSPPLTATEMDGKILLDWGSDQRGVEDVEKFNSKGFVFEGYNVYQLPSAGATAKQGILLATYDLTNEVTVISQETFDPKSGLILTLPVQQGSNSGIQRSLTVDWDRIREKPLYNGRTYYFGVEAYSYNPDPEATLKTLSSPLATVTVVPQTTKPGVRLHAAKGDTIKTVVHEGASDGSVTVLVTDPNKLTGHDYSVGFGTDADGNPIWYLVDTTTGDTVLNNQHNQSGDEDYLTTDGMMVKVMGPPLGIKAIVQVADGEGPLTDDEMDGAGRPYGGNNVWHSLSSPNDPNRFYISAGGGDGGIARMSRSIANADFHDFEMRFTDAGGVYTWWYDADTIAAVPFEAWDVGIGTFDDPSDDVRLLTGGYSGGATVGAFDFGYTDPAFGYPATDWVYFRKPLNADGTYDVYYNDVTSGAFTYGWWGNSLEVLARIIICDFGGGGTLPPSGTVIRWITNKANSENDTFTFTTKGFEPTVTKANAMADVNLINVFPNPYYGFNKSELDRYLRYVTFTHLPQKAIIRIFTLSGSLIRTIVKDDASQFAKWDLNNSNNLPAASGVYIVHIKLPDLGAERILKLAVIREQQFLAHF